MHAMNTPGHRQVKPMNDCGNSDLQTSSNLQVLCPQTTTRSKSPVTVQDWVAALPDDGQERVEEDKHGEKVTAEENDNAMMTREKFR